MKVNIKQLADLTELNYRTVKSRLKRLTPLEESSKGIIYSSADALALLYEAKTDSQDGLNLTAERARLAKEQADGQALKNAESRKELIPVSQIKEVWARIITSARNNFLALPSRLSRILETIDDTAERERVIDEEIRAILISLAEDKETPGT